jgi:hypothetical protein
MAEEEEEEEERWNFREGGGWTCRRSRRCGMSTAAARGGPFDADAA